MTNISFAKLTEKQEKKFRKDFSKKMSKYPLCHGMTGAELGKLTWVDIAAKEKKGGESGTILTATDSKGRAWIKKVNNRIERKMKERDRILSLGRAYTDYMNDPGNRGSFIIPICAVRYEKKTYKNDWVIYMPQVASGFENIFDIKFAFQQKHGELQSVKNFPGSW